MVKLIGGHYPCSRLPQKHRRGKGWRQSSKLERTCSCVSGIAGSQTVAPAGLGGSCGELKPVKLLLAYWRVSIPDGRITQAASDFSSRQRSNSGSTRDSSKQRVQCNTAAPNCHDHTDIRPMLSKDAPDGGILLASKPLTYSACKLKKLTHTHNANTKVCEGQIATYATQHDRCINVVD
jgi:hypothetical protein